MARKRPKPEEIVAKLRQVDVLTARGKSIGKLIGKSICSSKAAGCVALGAGRCAARGEPLARGVFGWGYPSRGRARRLRAGKSRFLLTGQRSGSRVSCRSCMTPGASDGAWRGGQRTAVASRGCKRQLFERDTR
jgi:hypothetical protein